MRPMEVQYILYSLLYLTIFYVVFNENILFVICVFFIWNFIHIVPLMWKSHMLSLFVNPTNRNSHYEHITVAFMSNVLHRSLWISIYIHTLYISQLVSCDKDLEQILTITRTGTMVVLIALNELSESSWYVEDGHSYVPNMYSYTMLYLFINMCMFISNCAILILYTSTAFL